VLIPVWPQIYHLETLPALKNLLRVAGDIPTYVVLNGLHPQATRQADEAKAMIADIYELSVCPVHLCDRAIYADVPAIGKSAQEVDPDGKAAEEIQRLFNFVTSQLKGDTYGQPQKFATSG